MCSIVNETQKEQKYKINATNVKKELLKKLITT